MKDTCIRLFHRLPSPARSVVASLWGRRLIAWRYGAETDRLVAEAIDREHWSEAQWQSFRAERLARLLDRAARRVPYYRELWAARRRGGDRRSPECLDNWPILEKEPLRSNPAAFVADDCDTAAMFHEHTSGTSGTSIDLWWSRDTVRQWYALFESRARRWYGVTRQSRWAIFGGQLVARAEARTPPFWVWNRALNQLYLSSYHLAPDLISSYLDAMVKYRPAYVLGYTSAIHAVAQEALRLGRRDVRFRVAVANAEPVFEHQRETIGAAFQCPVRETYGMAEIVAAASECEAGRLHLWPEVGTVEILDDFDRPVAATDAGQLVCTGLLNADMPLIRYRIGDRGAAAASGGCSCGRTLPILAQIEGRLDDVIYTVDGRAVGRLDPVFKGRLPVREAQIVQESLNRIRVRLVPAPDFTREAVDDLTQRLRARLGPVEVIAETLQAIPRTSRGKFRAVISELSTDDRERIKAGRAAAAGVR
jgi:phenylacetate-coenzyme A ligase PaaK-like adenylate-forming protein